MGGADDVDEPVQEALLVSRQELERRALGIGPGHGIGQRGMPRYSCCHQVNRWASKRPYALLVAARNFGPKPILGLGSGS